jgi:hypothetical protein
LFHFHIFLSGLVVVATVVAIVVLVIVATGPTDFVE